MRHRLIQVAFWLAALAAPLRAEAPLAVDVVPARLTSDLLWTELTGTIEAPETFTVAFRSNGRILAITAEVGENVVEGQTLARLDPLQAEAALRTAEAQLAAARADLVQAAQNRDRSQALLSRGAGTNAEFEAAQAGFIAAEAARDQAAAQLATALQDLEDTEIRAPSAGIVTSRRAETGQVVGAAQPVLTIAPDGRREAVFYAPNTPALDEMIGLEVQIALLEGASTTFPAVISEVSPLADAKTGTVTIRARLAPEAAPRLLGVPVRSKIALQLPQAVSLPWSALVTSQGEPAVWIVDPATGSVSLRPVTIARYTTSSVELEAGVAEGELVVGHGSHLLYPGRRVAVQGVQK